MSTSTTITLQPFCLLDDTRTRTDVSQGEVQKNMGLRAQLRDTNNPFCGHQPLENSRKTPNLAKKNETKGELCLAIENSSIKEVRRKESNQRNILKLKFEDAKKK